MVTNSLLKLKKILFDFYKFGEEMNYEIPNVWNAFFHKGKKVGKVTTSVNPYLFYHDAICYILENSQKRNLSLESSYMYSTMIRTSTSYDHDGSKKLEMKNSFGFKETGTFVKMIAYLPTLKKLGIDTLYLLPIMQASKYEKKGELGSVYGVVDFFQIEEDLFDPITKDLMTLDEQFKSFIEAAHTFGMNVVLDIIPRTNSVNSNLIITNPDWFYWIDISSMKEYSSPKVPTLLSGVNITKENICEVYSSPHVKKHIRLFTPPPNKRYPKKWAEFVSEYNSKKLKSDPLPLIEKHFQMRTAPAFSDVINDVQPPWTDVTYFRMYLDDPQILSEKNIAVDKNAPYMLFDTIKSNLFPGKIKNEKLWQMITEILPYYIKKFDIDGARIDMGHALPVELNKQIIACAKKEKATFYIIAEVLATDEESVKQAQEIGYDLVIGDGFYHTHRFAQKCTRNFYYNAATLPLAVFSAGETHDSPRLITRDGNFLTLQFVSILNLFAHNCVPFLNSGQELLELQPMNTGVDCNVKSKSKLEKTDPYYEKLALFDFYQFHYENVNLDFLNILEKAFAIRKRFIKMLLDKNAVTYLYYPDKEKIGLLYQNQFQKLFILANASLDKNLDFKHLSSNYEILLSTGDNSLNFKPLDIKIILEEK